MMKPVKKWIKIALDATVFVLLALLYRKQALGIAFHEIGGLALIGLFVVHHVCNGKWIAAVTRRLFAPTTPVKTRIQYAVDALLLIAFVLIGVSGACISKVVFSFGAHGGSWKTVHYFCAALALALVGVHVGLHASYLFGSLERTKLIRALSCILLAAALGFGVYSMATTSFTRWLCMPFTALQGAGKGEGYGAAAALAGTDAQSGESTGGRGNGTGNGAGAGQGNGQGGNGAGAKRGQAGGSLGTAALAALQFGSIATVFAALSAGVERLCGAKKRRARRDVNRI